MEPAEAAPDAVEDKGGAVADQIARARLTDVRQRIVSLRALQFELARMIEECTCGRVADYRVIETLTDTTHEHGWFYVAISIVNVRRVSDFSS